MFESEFVGELVIDGDDDDDVLEASERNDSSLILVCKGTSTLVDRMVSSSTVAVLPRIDVVAKDPVDFEKGDSSMGVAPMRDDGESKD